MTSDERRQDDIDAFWRDYLTNGDSFGAACASSSATSPTGLVASSAPRSSAVPERR